MPRILSVVLLVLALSLSMVGCGTDNQPAGVTPSAPPSSPVPAQQQMDANALYDKITTGMSYDDVMQIMAGQEPFMSSEQTIDTPAGKVTTNNVTWKIDKSLIIVMFEDKKVLAKDLTKMP